MTIIAGDVFSAFKAAGVADEVAKRAAAEVGDIKELPEITEGLGRIAVLSKRFLTPFSPFCGGLDVTIIAGEKVPFLP